MGYKSSNPMPGQPLVFSTKDILGNRVVFYHQTWLHILDHPEMSPYQSLIEPCIIDPTAIRSSTDSSVALVFETVVQNLPPEDLLRVIVKYADGAFMAGSSTGFVMTAFPVDSATYPNPKIGTVVYRKPSKTGGR
jgi:hypothetical protein